MSDLPVPVEKSSAIPVLPLRDVQGALIQVIHDGPHRARKRQHGQVGPVLIQHVVQQAPAARLRQVVTAVVLDGADNVKVGELPSSSITE